jgi:hypothetical protein
MLYLLLTGQKLTDYLRGKRSEIYPNPIIDFFMWSKNINNGEILVKNDVNGNYLFNYLVEISNLRIKKKPNYFFAIFYLLFMTISQQTINLIKNMKKLERHSRTSR